MTEKNPYNENPQEAHEPEEAQEWVDEDDTVIGTAFRWSLLVIVVIAAVGLGIYFLSREDAPQDTVRPIETSAPRTLQQGGEGVPQVSFTDITAEAGIDFSHENGARGDKYLPETMGGGVAFLDYDGDGDQDLLFVNSSDWAWSARPDPDPSLVLYRNEGRGRFSDVTRQAGFNESFYGMGVAVGDYDGDGDLDLFVTAVGSNRLLRNDGGRFSDVTSRAGVAGADDEWSSSAGFFDADGDGDLDLFVCNYVRWTRQIDLDLNFTLNGTDRAYGPPNSYAGTYPYFYLNNGDGTFTDASAQAGVQVDNPATGQPMAKSLALLTLDLDGDGDIDVAVANDTVQNFLFENQGDGTFLEIGDLAGIAYDFNGNATGAMGIDAGYHRNTDALAIGIGNFANEMSSLYVSQDEPMWFADEAIGEGIGSPSRLRLSFGLFFFDYDLDGRLDLLQANGHLEEEITEVQASQTYEQPAQLFWNQGNPEAAVFAEVDPQTVGDLARPIVGRGAAYADIDGDGDLDVVLTQTGRPPLLLRNDQSLGNHWLRVRLRAPAPNVHALGAWVEATSAGIRQRRPVMPTRSYLSQMELPVTFGLGRNASIESLKVIWPDGSVQEVSDVAVDQEVTIIKQP
ncbi:MAG TPA: CRTAC1 family protein [Acidobacteriota bacterium]|nr:CRTAC1 family protein [Acidobacteriota bacterium]